MEECSEDEQQTLGQSLLPRLLPGLNASAERSGVMLWFFQELLLQQICQEESARCLVTKRILEMEKALFKENMTFQWKSNFACCF